MRIVGKKTERKTNISLFPADIHTYKLTFLSFFSVFFAPSPLIVKTNKFRTWKLQQQKKPPRKIPIKIWNQQDEGSDNTAFFKESGFWLWCASSPWPLTWHLTKKRFPYSKMSFRGHLKVVSWPFLRGFFSFGLMMVQSYNDHYNKKATQKQ